MPRALALAVAAWMTSPALAADIPDHLADSLPYLAGSGALAPGYFDIEEESASIGYETRFTKWGAKVDQYMDVNPAITMDYGLLLTNKLGAGGRFTRQDDYSEIVLNGIYAPKRNLRFRMTGAQLRTTPGYLGMQDGAFDGFLQNSYLFGVKKYWNKYQHLADIGIAAYSIEANAPSSARIPQDDELPDADDALASAFAPGRLNGYLLSLGLRPTPLSKLELRHETGNLSYSFGAGMQRDERLVSNRISYSHYLGNCLRLQGGYSASTEFDRFDLKLAKHNWNIRLSRENDAGSSDTAVHFGYMLPLGRKRNHAMSCGFEQGGASSFESIVNAATQRPLQLPNDPLIAEAP